MLFFGLRFTCCAANLQSRVKKGKMSQEKFEKTLSLVKGVLTYDDFKSVDLVIEVRKGDNVGSVFGKYESAFLSNGFGMIFLILSIDVFSQVFFSHFTDDLVVGIP